MHVNVVVWNLEAVLLHLRRPEGWPESRECRWLHKIAKIKKSGRKPRQSQSTHRFSTCLIKGHNRVGASKLTNRISRNALQTLRETVKDKTPNYHNKRKQSSAQNYVAPVRVGGIFYHVLPRFYPPLLRRVFPLLQNTPKRKCTKRVGDAPGGHLWPLPCENWRLSQLTYNWMTTLLGSAGLNGFWSSHAPRRLVANWAPSEHEHKPFKVYKPLKLHLFNPRAWAKFYRGL
jgi:hypothetical protein